jgi:hypothetical protein
MKKLSTQNSGWSFKKIFKEEKEAAEKTPGQGGFRNPPGNKSMVFPPEKNLV